ncbi:sensor histidine kinase [Actinocorallia longicatena]|uniref:histidine kinase n=1 Tax=Actinocorallia longicatena TaxID=111803 RepID=A0ABP6QBI6_9ACTN
MKHALEAMIDAALREPAEPSRHTLIWPDRTWQRLAAMFVAVALGIGLAAGSIAIYIQQYHVPLTLAWTLGAAQAFPLVAAARWPLAAWRIMVAGLLWSCLAIGAGVEFMPWAVPAIVALVFVLFAVGASYSSRIAVGTGLVTAAVLLGVGISTGRIVPWFGMILAGIVVVTLLFGNAVGGRHQALELLDANEELRRQDLAKAAVLEERSRIARELHDVVAHHMSVIALQAEAAPYKIPDLPPPAKDTFELLRDEARRALTETRRVVGLLRSEDDSAERVPQPGLDRIHDLVSAHDGLTIDLRITGMPRPLSDGVDLSAFRIVQEALSNAARYAPGASVRVEVHYGTETLRIAVRDDGPKSAPEHSGGGHGLVGMRERVALFGGTLFTGPQGNGWAVLAELPYDGQHDPRGDR